MRGQSSAMQKLQSFYNLIWEVLSQHFCCILLVRSESVGPTHTQEEEIMKGHEYQVVGGHWGHLRGCLPQNLKMPQKITTFIITTKLQSIKQFI